MTKIEVSQEEEAVYQALIDQFDESIKTLFAKGQGGSTRSVMAARNAMNAMRNERDELKARLKGLEK